MDFYPEAHETYHVVPLYTDRFDVIVNFDHPIHKELVYGSVSIESLRGKDLLLPSSRSYGKMATFIRGLLPFEPELEFCLQAILNLQHHLRK